MMKKKLENFLKNTLRWEEINDGTIYATPKFHLLWRAFMDNYKELTGKEFKL